MRCEVMCLLDELRTSGGGQVVEQRGKKKQDEPLLRHLNRTVEGMSRAMDKIQEGEKLHQERQLRLQDYISRVADVTLHYLNRLEDSLVFAAPLSSAQHTHASTPSNTSGYTIRSSGVSLCAGTQGEAEGLRGAAEARMWENEVYTARMKVREEQDKARALAEQHNREMAAMRAEVQTLQDQLTMSRANGKDVVPASPDDLTLSAQLTSCKVKLAKATAELELARESIKAKNHALAQSRLDVQNVVEQGKSEKDALRESRERVARLEADIKAYRHASLF